VIVLLEYITIEFVPLAIEFVPFAVEFVALVLNSSLWQLNLLKQDENKM